MDIKTITTGLVTLVVAVIVIALVAVPVIEDQAAGKYVGNNTNPTDRYMDYTGQEISWTWKAGTGTLTVGTTTISTTNATPTIISDTLIVRTTSTPQYYIYDISGSQNTSHQGSNYQLDLTVTAAGAWEISVNDVSYSTGTLTKLWISQANGNIGSYSAPIHATIGNSVYLGNFTSPATNGPVRFAQFVDGEKVSDWFTPWTTSGGVISAGPEVTYDVDYQTEGTDQRIGSYEGVSTSWEDTTITTYNIYAPIQYESVGEAGGTNYVLMSIIPMLLFIVAIMVAVRMIRM